MFALRQRPNGGVIFYTRICANRLVKLHIAVARAFRVMSDVNKMFVSVTSIIIASGRFIRRGNIYTSLTA